MVVRRPLGGRRCRLGPVDSRYFLSCTPDTASLSEAHTLLLQHCLLASGRGWHCTSTSTSCVQENVKDSEQQRQRNGTTARDGSK